MNRKGETFFDAITLLPEGMVEEAQDYVFRKSRTSWRKFASLAACMMLVVSLGLLAALPSPPASSLTPSPFQYRRINKARSSIPKPCSHRAIRPLNSAASTVFWTFSGEGTQSSNSLRRISAPPKRFKACRPFRLETYPPATCRRSRKTRLMARSRPRSSPPW